MKKMIPVLLVMSFVTTMFADDYKILMMNTKTIRIGTRIYKKGDTFSGDSVIFWEKDKQALKAQNLTTKEIRLFAEPEFRAIGCKTIKEYYVKNNHLSTRSNVLTLEDMKEELAGIETFYLLDTIYIKSPMPIDSTRYFYVSYDNEGKSEKKVLKMKDDILIVINRSIFPVNDTISEMSMSMFYYKKGIEDDYLLSDSMRIMLIPRRIKK